MKTLKHLFMLGLFCLISLAASAAVYSGSCGGNAKWSLDTSTGLLSITGSGKMTDYNYFSPAPWDKYCNDITSLSIGDQITSIGSSAFYNCSGLTSVTIPNSVTSIGESAFALCSGLTSVAIPNSVTSIGSYAFVGCSGLTSVTIPNSVTSIGSSAFVLCSSLTSIAVESGNKVYDSRNNCNAIIETASNTLVTGCKNTTIPNSVTSIGDYAFYGCSGLTSVTIPNSVIEIGWYAFQNCSGLTSVTIGNYVTSIGNQAFCRCSGLTSVTIPNSVTSIAYAAFSDCSGLTSVTIPNSVTSIEDYTFSGCSGLTSVTIPNSVTSIGNYAFYRCSGLTSVTIPNSVTSIGEDAFWGCSGLTSVTIPNSVTSIGSYAFAWCSGLTSVYAKWKDAVKIPALTSSDFPYSTCDLYVPTGTKAIYQSKDYWNTFKNIYEYELESVLLGDANDDSNVNVNDITTIATYILNGTATPWNEKNADANQDGSINVNDITATAGIILNGDDDDETTCADVISGPDGKIYRVTGTCTAITNTQYGNWYLNDGTGEVYIYGTLDAKGQTKNFLSLGIEVGDVITVEGPKNTYNTTVELVDVTVINIQKSLVKVDSLTVDGVKNDHVGVEGGNIVVHLTCKGDVVNVEIPEEAKGWLSVASVTSGSNPIVTLDVATNTGGDRSATIVFKTHSNKKEYTAQATIYQKGSIQEISVADFLAAPVGDAQYRLTGIIVNVANESYGNCTIRDYSGEVYVYGIGAKGDFGKLGLKAGDIVTLVGQRGAYNDSPQMAKGQYESHKSVIEVSVADFLTKPDDANVYYMVSGEITTIDNSTYGNCHIKDGDSELYVYGCYPGWGATGDARKNFMATAGIEVGDRLTVIGPKTTYVTTIELNGGIYFSHQKP